MGRLQTILVMSWEEANALLLAGLPIYERAWRKNKYIYIEGYRVNLRSNRYKVFRRSQVCTCCGKIGSIMKLEYHSGSQLKTAHFNLYKL